MPLEPTIFICGRYGCTTAPHDRQVEHKCTFAPTAPQTLVNCMRPDCSTPPHGQHIQHKHTFNKKGTP